MIRTVIVDDEPLAREGLRTRLTSERDVTVIGEAGDGPTAVEAVRTLRPELLFLDIQMPGMDGFAVLRELGPEELPLVVFVTAFDRYAIQAFEVHAQDYLLKPYLGARLEEVIERVRRELRRSDLADRHERIRRLVAADCSDSPPIADKSGPKFIGAGLLPIRDGERYILLHPREIDYLESGGNTVRIHARGTVFRMRATLRQMADQLAGSRFVRIHRSVIVNVERVAAIVPEWHGDFEVILTTGARLRMSRTHRENLIP